MDTDGARTIFKDTHKSLLELFNEYAEDVYGIHRLDRLNELRTDLQRRQYL
jgi:hypothetical protein